MAVTPLQVVTPSTGEKLQVQLPAGAQAVAFIGQPTVNVGAGPGSATIANNATIYRGPALSAKESVKVGAGRIWWMQVFNPGATAAYIHVYNSAVAGVTVGATVPVVSIAVPPGQAVWLDFDQNPVNFTTGITVAATTSAVHTVATAPGTPLPTVIGFT